MAAIFAQHPSAEPGSNNDIHCGILLISADPAPAPPLTKLAAVTPAVYSLVCR